MQELSQGQWEWLEIMKIHVADVFMPDPGKREVVSFWFFKIEAFQGKRLKASIAIYGGGRKV